MPNQGPRPRVWVAVGVCSPARSARGCKRSVLATLFWNLKGAPTPTAVYCEMDDEDQPGPWSGAPARCVGRAEPRADLTVPKRSLLQPPNRERPALPPSARSLSSARRLASRDRVGDVPVVTLGAERSSTWSF